MSRWEAFFWVEQARTAMVWQHVLAAIRESGEDPSDFEYLQTLDFERPVDNPGELLRKARGE